MIDNFLQQTKLSLCERCYVSPVTGICPIKIFANNERDIELLKTDTQMEYTVWLEKQTQNKAPSMCVYIIY